MLALVRLINADTVTSFAATSLRLARPRLPRAETVLLATVKDPTWVVQALDHEEPVKSWNGGATFGSTAVAIKLSKVGAAVDRIPTRPGAVMDLSVAEVTNVPLKKTFN